MEVIETKQNTQKSAQNKTDQSLLVFTVNDEAGLSPLFPETSTRTTAFDVCAERGSFYSLDVLRRPCPQYVTTRLLRITHLVVRWGRLECIVARDAEIYPRSLLDLEI